jgi:heptosyltransferase-2
MARAEILVVKLGALGDVLRTTPLLRRLKGRVTWATKKEAFPLLAGNPKIARLIDANSPGSLTARRYDLVVNFDEDDAACRLAAKADASRRVGAYFRDGEKAYCAASAPWFDMSLISRLGRTKADILKRRRRRTYQDYLFRACGFEFHGEEYMLPGAYARAQKGSVALEATAGRTWPLKRWTEYGELFAALNSEGTPAFVLRRRRSLLDYARDVAAAEVIVAGDTLAMHLGLALRRRVVALFTCTSPDEIHGYGRLIKLTHPDLAEYFYRRDDRAPSRGGIPVERVLRAVRRR